MGLKISFSDKKEKEMQEVIEELKQELEMEKIRCRYRIEQYKRRIHLEQSEVTELKHKLLSVGVDPEDGVVRTLDDVLDSIEKQVEQDGQN